MKEFFEQKKLPLPKFLRLDFYLDENNGKPVFIEIEGFDAYLAFEEHTLAYPEKNWSQIYVDEIAAYAKKLGAWLNDNI